MLTFDEESHLYLHDGDPIPSVTQVIGQYKEVKIGDLVWLVDTFTGEAYDPEMFRRAAEVGTAIHKGCALLAQGKQLNWNALPEQLVAPLERFVQWMADFCVEPVMVEKPLADSKLWYAGTGDLFCRVCGDLTAVDIKTFKPTWSVGPQTAAYEKLYRWHESFTGKMKRAALHLPKDGGKPKLIPLKNKNDWPWFKARLAAHNLHAAVA